MEFYSEEQQENFHHERTKNLSKEGKAALEDPSEIIRSIERKLNLCSKINPLLNINLIRSISLN